MKQFVEAEVRAALEASAGNLALAAADLDVGRDELRTYIQNVPELVVVLWDKRETVVDHAETAVFGEVRNHKPWAIKFVLLTLGRDRFCGKGDEKAPLRAHPRRNQKRKPQLTAAQAAECERLRAIATGKSTEAMPPEPAFVPVLDKRQQARGEVREVLQQVEGDVHRAARKLGVDYPQLMEYLAPPAASIHRGRQCTRDADRSCGVGVVSGGCRQEAVGDPPHSHDAGRRARLCQIFPAAEGAGATGAPRSGQPGRRTVGPVGRRDQEGARRGGQGDCGQRENARCRQRHRLSRQRLCRQRKSKSRPWSCAASGRRETNGGSASGREKAGGGRPPAAEKKPAVIPQAAEKKPAVVPVPVAAKAVPLPAPKAPSGPGKVYRAETIDFTAIWQKSAAAFQDPFGRLAPLTPTPNAPFAIFGKDADLRRAEAAAIFADTVGSRRAGQGKKTGPDDKKQTDAKNEQTGKELAKKSESGP